MEDSRPDRRPCSRFEGGGPAPIVPPGRRIGWLLLAGSLLVTSWACRPQVREPEGLRVVGIQPRPGQASYLNEPLVITFDADLDLASVTSRSARIVHDGQERPGSWEADGPHLTWRPLPLLSSDLQDGSLVPGERHELVLSGFPRPDALRSVDGGQLEATLRHAFEAVAAETNPALLDLSMDPGRCEPLRPRGVLPGGVAVLRTADPLVLECAEPLDPTSVRGSDFWVEVDPASPGPRGSAAGEALPVRVRLVRNEPFRSRSAAACAALEFWPEVPLEDGAYLLRSQPRPSLCDMGGNPAIQEVDNAVLARFRVVSTARGTGADLRLEFLSDERLSPQPVPWADGAARWSGDGSLRVGFPAAAGSGRDGRVVLTGDAAPPARIEAQQLLVPQGQSLRLEGHDGLLLLQAQGTLRLAGDLVREETGSPHEPIPAAAPGTRLSEWLDGAVQQDAPWTVLVAGGDLVIEGELRVDTPLILAAGGRVRVLGSVRCRSEELHLFGEGGGLGLPGLPGPLPGILVDAPVQNPLEAPLVLAAVTSALPEEVHSAYAWGSLQVGADAGAGSVEIGFLSASEPLERERLRTHPGLVEAPGPIRMVVELRVPPGAAWEPPSLDFVHLAWSAEAR